VCRTVTLDSTIAPAMEIPLASKERKLVPRPIVSAVHALPHQVWTSVTNATSAGTCGALPVSVPVRVWTCPDCCPKEQPLTLCCRACYAEKTSKTTMSCRSSLTLTWHRALTQPLHGG
jgi:hypothetical protein